LQTLVKKVAVVGLTGLSDKKMFQVVFVAARLELKIPN